MNHFGFRCLWLLVGLLPACSHIHTGTWRLDNGLSAQQVDAVFRRNEGEINGCFAKALAKDRRLTGTLVLQFTVSPEGNAAGAKIIERDFSSDPLESCLLDKLDTWHFPMARKPTEVDRYPLKLERR